MPASRSLRRLALTTAALVAAVFFYLLVSLPPRPLTISLDGVDPDVRGRTVAGAYHVHTTRSDGAGDKASIAAAAAHAGLRFVIFTDHGDATRPPDPPAYLNGVLCIDAVEISTTHGHYVALDLPAAPYPFAGEPSAVVEDVKRLGGFGIVAHPDHPRPGLEWTDWQPPIDGLEWINADVEWRNESAWKLAKVLFQFMVRPGPALASVFDRPERTLDRWDSLERLRPVVGLAAADAHGRGRRSREEGNAPDFNAGPGYEETFLAMSNRVLLERPLSGDASGDARLILGAIREGRVYSVIDAISKDVVLGLDPSGQFTLVSPAPPGMRIVHSGSTSNSRLELQAAHAPGNPPVPWVIANRRQDRAVGPPQPVSDVPITRTESFKLLSDWRVEKDSLSAGAASGSGEGVTLRYKLAEGTRASQFVAAAADLDKGSSFAGVSFRGRAEHPMRVAVQFRFLPNDARWVKSVYLGPEEREVVLLLNGFRPAEDISSDPPLASRARSILFVVDLVNARPGDAGAFTITALRAIR
jgi:hypothetical protein